MIKTPRRSHAQKQLSSYHWTLPMMYLSAMAVFVISRLLLGK